MKGSACVVVFIFVLCVNVIPNQTVNAAQCQ